MANDYTSTNDAEELYRDEFGERIGEADTTMDEDEGLMADETIDDDMTPAGETFGETLRQDEESELDQPDTEPEAEAATESDAPADADRDTWAG